MNFIMNYGVAVCMVMVSFFTIPTGYAADVHSFTSEVDKLLKESVDGQGKVDYKGIKNNFELVDQLYRQVGSLSLERTSGFDKKAFYINAYNLIVIHEIAKAFPVSSPMDIPGFFDKKRHRVAGETLTLNGLEKEKLIQTFQDPRVHFALVCAAVSCPPLANEAYQGNRLDEQLNARTKKALNDDQFIRINNDKKQVELSKIFDWYNKDFTKSGSVLAFINQYRNQKIPADYKVSYYEYDWQLNGL